MEWRLRGRRKDGTPMEFAWVNIFEVRGGRFVRGRIYTELMREGGGIEVACSQNALTWPFGRPLV